MAINLKTKSELALMRDAGQILAEVLETLKEAVKVGVSTEYLDELAFKKIKELKATPSFLGYGSPPFPGVICASVNEVVVHGLPSPKCILKEGDIISLDVGVSYKGWQADAARTFCVGEVKPEIAQLVKVTEESFWQGYNQFKVGNRLGDVQAAIQNHAEKYGYGIVRDFTGHGLGKSLHEDPSIPNYGRAGRGLRLIEGLVVCVEPMLNLGQEEVYVAADRWSVLTVDHLPSAHYENTIALTENGPEVFTILH